VPGRDLSKNKQRRRLRHHLTEEAARERPFSYDAVWEGGLEAYTSRYVRANLWRMTRTCDYDDAMQEARIVFLRCARQYKHQLDNAAWFMGVYKRSLAGRFADIATKDTRYRVVGELPSVANGDDDPTPYVQEPVGELSNMGELMCLIREAPSEVREVLALLFSAPLEIIQMATAAWRAGGRRELFEDAMINRLLGRDPTHPSLERVRKHFE